MTTFRYLITAEDAGDQIQHFLRFKQGISRKVVISLKHLPEGILLNGFHARTIDLLRRAGAKEIHMRVSAPPFVSECYYGTDIDSREHLIACHHTVEEIAEIIGVDSLGYLPLGNLRDLCGSEEYCSACFDGDYPTAIPEDTRKDQFEQKLSQRKAGEKP